MKVGNKPESGKPSARFIAVRDNSRKKVRGLWRRGARYYLQLKAPGERSPRRIPLEARTLTDAKMEMERKKLEIRDGNTPARGRKPLFQDYADTYIALLEGSQQCNKRAGTIAGERQSLERWKQQIGVVRLDKITPAMIVNFRDQRLLAGRSPRTVNLEVQHLRNLLGKAIDDGLLFVSPTDRIKQLAYKTPKRPLLTTAQFEDLCSAALTACKLNGQELHDYLRFLAYSGAREKEALRVRWVDVDWKRKVVVIGADGLSKNGEQRVVDLNPALEQHLRQCWNRRDPHCSYLFPCPRRGDRDIPAKTFRESLRIARKAAKLENFAVHNSRVERGLIPKNKGVGFHDCRHFFASMCVMAGVTFMQIAAWLGHKDGGLLVGRVYGHLAENFGHLSAAKVVFHPTVVSIGQNELVAYA